MWAREYVGAVAFAVHFDDIPAKGRPRFTRGGRAYTPPKTAAAEHKVRAAFEAQGGARWGSFGGPVKVRIEIYKPLAKSNPKQWTGRANLQRPDADNVAKLILDALNGVAWRDDSQITDLHVLKHPRGATGTESGMDVRIMYYDERRVKEA